MKRELRIWLEAVTFVVLGVLIGWGLQHVVIK